MSDQCHRSHAEGNACRDLQQKTEDARGQAILANADPHDGCAFERPRCRRPASIERQRHGERRKNDAERKKRFDEQTQIFALAAP